MHFKLFAHMMHPYKSIRMYILIVCLIKTELVLSLSIVSLSREMDVPVNMIIENVKLILECRMSFTLVLVIWSSPHHTRVHNTCSGLHHTIPESTTLVLVITTTY